MDYLENSMNEKQMFQIVEQFSRQSYPADGPIKVTRVPDRTTVFVEQFGGNGQSIIMNEYKVDGKNYWAGYSMRSQTVYVSLA
jgi:hypothetical protein